MGLPLLNILHETLATFQNILFTMQLTRIDPGLKQRRYIHHGNIVLVHVEIFSNARIIESDML